MYNEDTHGFKNYLCAKRGEKKEIKLILIDAMSVCSVVLVASKKQIR